MGSYEIKSIADINGDRLKIYAFHVMEEEMQYLGLRYMNIKIKNIVC